MERFLLLLPFRDLPRWKRFLSAGVLAVLAALIRTAVPSLGLPFLFFIPVLMAIGFALGRGPGFLATLVSTVMAAYLFVGAPFSFALSQSEWVATGLFGLVGLGIVAVCDTFAAGLVQSKTDLKSLAASRAALAESDAFLRSVLASSTDCIKVLDLEGRITFMSEGGQAVMEVSDFNQIEGCPWPSFWERRDDAAAIAAIEAARAGQATSFIGEAETMAGNSRWWHVAVSPIPGPDGRPERILAVSRDITALRKSEEQRERYVLLVENSADFIGMVRLDGSLFFVNDAGRRLVGLPHDALEEAQMADLLIPEQQASLAAEILPDVERTGFWTGERQFRHVQTGEPIPVWCTLFPVQDAGGHLAGFGTVTRDIRSAKRAEERQAIINGEILHRLKNTLAMVQSIAAMTLRKSLPPEVLNQFDARLQALARAHELLRQAEWQAGGLAELVSGVLENLGLLDRCRLSGPPVQLGPRAAMSTSLLLHELATNALKHGALSAPAGTVEIAWRVEGDKGSKELRLDWTECGGPPALAPAQKGFGSKLVSLGLVGTGGVSLRYAETGLSAQFRARMELLEQE